MQSSDGEKAAVYVSCGGNPFGETSLEYPQYGDGWPAIARLQIIAAQELGHYADMIRDQYFRHIDRHSADIMGRRAKPKVLQARRSDVKTSKNFLSNLEQHGIQTLIKHESDIKFFRKNKIYNLKYLYHLTISYYYRTKILNAVKNSELSFIRKFSRDSYLGLMLKALQEDMLFNLTPQADVYKREDKEEEEAIACIEALARVPQQVIKWGHLPTKHFMEQLYHVYYSEVIPSLITSFEKATKQKYKRDYTRIDFPLIKRIIIFLQSLYPFQKPPPLPSREI
jgi:Protein of unknown function (DUF2748)